MKKYIILTIILCGIILLTGCAYGYNKNTGGKQTPKPENSNVELLATMDSESDAKNQVWVGTFQLIWNDLVNEILHQPVTFVDFNSLMAESLNRQSFTTNDISENAYYKKWGHPSPKLKHEIETGIKKKFNEKSEILDYVDWSENPNNYILYAMLKKDFEYIEKFEKLEPDKFNGSSGYVDYFGFTDETSNKIRNSIGVLFYENPASYAVNLKTKTGDEVLLYRTDNKKTLDKIYAEMLNKEENYTGNKFIMEKDEFKSPILDFKKTEKFDELCNKQITGTDYHLSEAIETIDFKMDESGVKLKSEAIIAVEKGMAIVHIKPRYFYFNDNFYIFIRENNKKPYFAMRISDAKLLQK